MIWWKVGENGRLCARAVSLSYKRGKQQSGPRLLCETGFGTTSIYKEVWNPVRMSNAVDQPIAALLSHPEESYPDPAQQTNQHFPSNKRGMGEFSTRQLEFY